MTIKITYNEILAIANGITTDGRTFIELIRKAVYVGIFRKNATSDSILCIKNVITVVITDTILLSNSIIYTPFL